MMKKGKERKRDMKKDMNRNAKMNGELKGAVLNIRLLSLLLAVCLVLSPVTAFSYSDGEAPAGDVEALFSDDGVESYPGDGAGDTAGVVPIGVPVSNVPVGIPDSGVPDGGVPVGISDGRAPIDLTVGGVPDGKGENGLAPLSLDGEGLLFAAAAAAAADEDPIPEGENVALESKGGAVYLGEGTYPNNNYQIWLNNGAPMGAPWSDWGDPNNFSNDAVIGVKLGKPYTVNSVELLVYTDPPGGGVQVPAAITVQYWDETAKIFKDAANQTTAGIIGNPVQSAELYNYSVIGFDKVLTSDVRLVLKHNGAAVGLLEFRVYGEDFEYNAALSVNGGRAFVENTVTQAGTSASSANDGLIGTGSGYWTDWDSAKMNNNSYLDPVYFGVRLYKEYTVHAVNIYFISDGGGCFPPRILQIQYWDEDSETYVDVQNQSPANNGTFSGNGTGTLGTPISFDPVKTSRIRAVMTRAVSPPLGRTVGITEFEVFTYDEIEEVVIETAATDLPREADFVAGVAGANTIISLNSAANNGAWRFLYDVPGHDLAPGSNGIPLPELDAVEDFNFSQWNNENWKAVTVPGGLVMQGFDIKNNKEYYYQREITIPADYGDNRILIRFDAVYTNTRVWINGNYVRTHKGGFTTWDCDVTSFVKPGQTVTLTVGVTDLYGSQVGEWNPYGGSTADPSGATYYANHNIGGITRDVSLIVLPNDYISRVYLSTFFTDTTFTDANLNIKAQLGMVSDNASLLLEVVSKEGNVVASDTVNFAKGEGDDGEGDDGDGNGSDGDGGDAGDKLSALKELSILVNSPLKWDAEHPNLYTLRSTLTVNGVIREVSTQRFGFRQLDFGGSFGDSNKVYINGKEIQLRGTCRHDVSWEFGRSTTKEIDYQEIRDYKSSNINFIRTSHYPVSRHLLDACDELGIYVEEENAACWGPVGCPPEEYLEGFKEVIERDRNRACIIMWSLANESSWALPFRMEYNFIREEDPSRMVIFSFPSTVPANETDVYFDIYSVHYDGWNSGGLGNPNMPVLHDEYCPSSVHHYYEIQRDNSSKVFYEQSIYKFWDNVLRTDGALGGAIWCADDEVFFIPEGTTKNRGAQGYYDGYATGDGAWGAVHDSYKRLKTEAWLVKKGYSPVRLNEKVFVATDSVLTIPVNSGFDHTNFNEMTIRYSIDGGPVKTAEAPSIAPHARGSIIISDTGLKGASQVAIDFFTTFNGVESLVDTFLFNLAETSYTFTPASGNAPGLFEDGNAIIVSGQDFSVTFSKATGLISEAKFKNETLITGGPYLSIPDADFGVLDNIWIPAAVDGVTAEIIDNFAVVSLSGQYARGQGVEFTVTISANGIITTSYRLTSAPESNVLTILKSVGVSYDIPSDVRSVNWNRNTFHNVYPANSIARPVGEALKVRPGWEQNPDVYGKKPDWDWYMDMKEFSLFVLDDPRDGIITSDFKTMRENIWYYDVNFTGTNNRISVESDTSDAVQVVVSPAWELIDCRNTDRIEYTGSWAWRDNSTAGFSLGNGNTNNYAFNRTERTTAQDNASAALVFEGTGVSYIAGRENGLLDVYIDGAFMRRIDSIGSWGNSKRRILYSINGLPLGTHSIEIRKVSGASISLDAFAVLKGAATDPAHQNSQLVISQQWYHPDLNWGSYTGVAPTLANGTTGSATIRLTDADNKIPVVTAPIFVPVNDIINVPQSMMVGSLRLIGTVVPADATSTDIIWSVKNAGGTGAIVTGNTLRVETTGAVIITAEILGGRNAGSYKKDFLVYVWENVALASNGGVMYTGPNTQTESGRYVTSLNNGVIGGAYWTDFSMVGYNGTYPDDATIGVTLSQVYNVNAIELYDLHDGGGCFAPSLIIVQYWDEAAQEFKNIQNQSRTTGFSGDTSGTVGNLITFDPVETSRIQAVMTHANDSEHGRAIALTEFAVYKYFEVVPVTGVTLDKTAISIPVGQTATLTETVSPANATNSLVAWSSSDESVASVFYGVVTAHSVGTAVITVTTEDGDYTATCLVTVTYPKDTLTVNGVDIIFEVIDGVAVLDLRGLTQAQLNAIFGAPGSEVVFNLEGYDSVDLLVEAGWFKDIDKNVKIITSKGSCSVKTKTLWNNSGKSRYITVRNNNLSLKNV